MYVCVCIYIHIYIHAYIHTYIHIEFEPCSASKARICRSVMCKTSCFHAARIKMA